MDGPATNHQLTNPNGGQQQGPNRPKQKLQGGLASYLQANKY